MAIGVNMFTNANNSYVQAKVVVADYAALRNNTISSVNTFNVAGSFTIQPATTYSSSVGTLYMVEHWDGASAMYNFWTLAPGSPPVLTLVGGTHKVNPLGAGRTSPATWARRAAVIPSTPVTAGSSTRSIATAGSTTHRPSG